MNFYHQLKASKQTQKFQDVAEQQLRNISTEDSSSHYPKPPSRKPTQSFEMELELPYKIQKHDLDFQEYGVEVIESEQISDLLSQFQKYRKLESRSNIWQHINSVQQKENSIILKVMKQLIISLKGLPDQLILQVSIFKSLQWRQQNLTNRQVRVYHQSIIDDLIQYDDGSIHIKASSQLKEGYRQPILKALAQFCNDFQETTLSSVLQQILHAFGMKDQIKLRQIPITDKYLHFLRLNLLEQLRK
ncbi:hypothetical protein pb186bvf_001033 [Paramecium bursaria]